MPTPVHLIIFTHPVLISQVRIRSVYGSFRVRSCSFATSAFDLRITQSEFNTSPTTPASTTIQS